MHLIVGTLQDALLARSQYPGLLCDIAKTADDLLVAIDKTVKSIRDANFTAKVLYKLLRPAQIVSWDTGIQVVDGLELKASVEEVEPLRAVDVHGRT